MNATRFQTEDRWGFVPGPTELAEPMDSLHLQDIVEISPADIAQSMLSFPGMRLLHVETPSWWDWRARWESGTDFIEMGMTLFENEAQSWGGSNLITDCSVKDIEALWSHLQARHQGVWLHDSDCTIHTRDSFRQEISSLSSEFMSDHFEMLVDVEATPECEWGQFSRFHMKHRQHC